MTTPAPLSAELPLMDLEWPAFERFCSDLVQGLPHVNRCHRYGVQGDPQQGIDLVASTMDGRRWAFQCKRERRFGPRQLKEAIAAASYSADRYLLLLASRATAALRSAAGQYPEWEIWDSEDIARQVRSLPAESARVLVETHFGSEWRRQFLGIGGPAQFISAEEFFRPLLGDFRLFHHAWTTIGRQEVLGELQRFVVSPRHRIAVLAGRGGVGKSKILHAFSDAAGSGNTVPSLRFAVPGVPLAPALDQLEAAPLVIIADDAHRREDLALLFAAARRREPPLRLVLTIRPHSRDALLGEIARAGFDQSEVLVLDELRELTRSESENLAREALGPEYAYLAEALVALSWDSPLVTVLGGQLVRTAQVHPGLLARREEFRRAVLDAFSDALLGQLGARASDRICGDLLRLAAAVGPFRPDLDCFRDAASAFLEVRREELQVALDEMEVAGVFLRRGRTLRITPDVLADHVLEEACFAHDGTPTDYAHRVHTSFSAVAPGALLRNLAELDWRRYRSGATGAGEHLLRGIWKEMEVELRSARAARKIELIRGVAPIAYYQPGPALRLVRIALDPPPEIVRAAQASEWPALLRAVARVLASISYNLEYTAECCDLLWCLGRDEPQETWDDPDHAMSVLRDLASYRMHKSLALQEAVVAAVERWVMEPGAHEHLHSPLEPLNQVLAKTSVSPRRTGYEYEWRPFPVAPEPTSALRAKAFALIRRLAETGETRAKRGAIRSLGLLLQEPIALMGMDLPDGFVDVWEPEEKRALAALAELCARPLHPLLLLKCVEVLVRRLDRRGEDPLKSAVAQVRDSIPRSFELRFVELLLRAGVRGTYDVEPWTTRHLGVDSWERHDSGRKETAAEFLAHYPAPADGVRRIASEMVRIETFGLEANCIAVAEYVAAVDPDYAAEVCELVVFGPPSPIRQRIDPWLYRIKQPRPDRYLRLARHILDRGEAGHCGSLAGTLWDLEGPSLAGEDDLLAAVLRHPDDHVRWNALPSLHLLARRDQRRALDLALGMEVGRSAEVAERFAELFWGAWDIIPDALPPAVWDAILEKLILAEHLETAAVIDLLRNAATHAPHALARTLMARVRLADSETRAYKAIPSLGEHSLDGFLLCPVHDSILREIRDPALVFPRPSSEWLPSLYELVSVGYGDTGLSILREWIDGAGAQGVTGACVLLQSIPPEFLTKRIDFIENLLQRADAAGAEVPETVRTVLSGPVHRVAVGARIVGSPWPELVEIRDTGRVLATQACRSRAFRDFYDELADLADAWIRDARAYDEERFL